MEENGGCSINESCTSYNAGRGNSECLKCKPIIQAANRGNHYHRGLLTDSELIEDVQQNDKLTSIFQCLAKIDPTERQIFEDYQFGDLTMNELARQHGTNRQAIYRTIKRVRHDVKKMLSLSTVF